jgi:hypothetical protein
LRFKRAMVRARLVATLVFTLGVMPWAATAYAQNVMPQRVDFLKQAEAQPFFSSYSRVTFRLAEPVQAPAPRLPQIPLPPVVLKAPRLSGTAGKSLLNSLYATTVLMQVLDIHSTMQAMNNGAIEGNPAMSHIAGKPGAFIATKAAVAAASIWAANKMAKRNKVAAVMTLVAVNSAYAAIVSNNYRLANR